MATTTNITTTYAGEKAGKYIGAALLSAPTLAQNAVTVKQNIKYKQVVKTFAASGLSADATCDFTPTGTITIAERVLTPKELQVNLNLCKAEFRDDWDAISMGYSAMDQLPPDLQTYIIERVSKQIAAETEVNVWTGADATGGSFTGFATAIALDANLPSAQEIAGTSVTASNVIAQLRSMIDALPARLYGVDGLTLYVSQNIYKCYLQALGGYAASGVGANGYDNKGSMWFTGQPLFIDGVPLFMANGMANNTAMLTYKENLWFGTGLLNDHNTVKIIDMADIDGSENVRFVMRYTAGTQYGFAGDIVTYGITNSAN